ncbi:MAG: hypothetical protein NW206_11895 [Hyphomonadaceae bacterium]|nr:hypothetical protein [Hyphomonadaceae bacterium]
MFPHNEYRPTFALRVSSFAASALLVLILALPILSVAARVVA